MVIINDACVNHKLHVYTWAQTHFNPSVFSDKVLVCFCLCTIPPNITLNDQVIIFWSSAVGFLFVVFFFSTHFLNQWEFKGRQDVNDVTFFDHMTVIIKYIVLGNKHCWGQVVWIVYIIQSFVRKYISSLIFVSQNPIFQFIFSRLKYSDPLYYVKHSNVK